MFCEVGKRERECVLIKALSPNGVIEVLAVNVFKAANELLIELEFFTTFMH